jgi:Tfp pilus assembly PilM family ATPase
MISPLSSFRLEGFTPPVRRVLALDLGSRRLKMLLAESDFGRLRILKEEMIDLHAEGLVSPEEIKTHLAASLENWGNPPLALVLPEHLSSSQVIDLPNVPEAEVEKLIAEQAQKLSGVTESRVVYDFVPTEIPSKNRQQFWVTLCQETEIRDRILRLGLEHQDICEVTTTANALIVSHRAAAPLSSRAILVHLGAQSTVVVVLIAGQGAFATSFQMGGDFFTRAIARIQSCSEEKAEALKHERNFLSGPNASEPFIEVVDGWVAELKRQLNEWFQENPTLAAEVRSFELVASGGGFEQPGLREYLKTEGGLELQPPMKGAPPEALAANSGFEVAFGAALQALGHSEKTVSLLPQDYRQAWRKRIVQQRVEMVSFLLVAVCVLLLGLGTWRKLSLYTAKKELLDKVQAGQTAVDANDAFMTDLAAEYESLRPLVASHQNTVDVLKTISLIQQSASKTNFWYVLLADQQSYFSGPLAILSTNRPAKTNLLGPALESLRPVPLVPRVLPWALTNIIPSKPGLIAELCVPGEAEASRQVLIELVNGWKQQAMFSKVDLLSEDLRRNLADPKVLVPDRHYVLALDFAETDFQQPVHLKKPASGLRGPRRIIKPAPAPVPPEQAGSGAGYGP